MLLSKIPFMRKQAANIVLGVILASTSFALQAEITSHETSAKSGFEQVKAGVFPALVRIYVVSEGPANGRMTKSQSSGSGAILTKDGYVVTNHHVAGNGSHFVVNLSTQEEVRADLIGTDPLSDIAVLKLRKEDLKNPEADLPIAQWGDSGDVKVGDTVYAMGSPGGLSQSITKGIITNTSMIMAKNSQGQNLDGENVAELVLWLGHDADIFGGNSGGPLVDGKGNIIGINEISIANLSGAIPANLARYSAEQIIENGEVPRSWYGLELQPRLKSKVSGSGVLISAVTVGSPAEQAGLQSGDLITHFGGEVTDVEIPEDLPGVNELMYHSPIGKKVTIGFVRDGKVKESTIKSVARELKILPQQELTLWGMTAGNISRDQLIKMGRDTRNGVQVGTVRAIGSAAQAKPSLRPGDIITSVGDQQIDNVDTLKVWSDSFSQGEESPKPALVAFEREGQKLLSVVSLGKRKPSKPARSVRKGWLPIKTQVITTDLSKMMGLEGISGFRVTGVSSEDFKDLQSGDIITAVNGKKVTVNDRSSGSDFLSLLRKYPSTTSLNISIIRDDKEMVVSTPLMKTPKPKSEFPMLEDDIFQLKVSGLNGGSDRSGVRIDEVVSGGWAFINGIKPGDVLLAINGEAIDSLDVFEGSLSKISSDKPRYVVFKIERSSVEKFIEIEPHW